LKIFSKKQKNAPSSKEGRRRMGGRIKEGGNNKEGSLACLVRPNS
jgi:hypothetical protein